MRFPQHSLIAGLTLFGLLGIYLRLADRLVRPVTPPAGDGGQFIDVDGVHTYYRVRGNGPPMLLVHGLGLSHLSWDASSTALAEHFTVYALDLPGFGYSDKPPGYGSARQEGAFLGRFLAALGLDRATVVGHSMGGAAALWLAALHPKRVERLVLVNISEMADAAPIFRMIALPILGELLLKSITPLSMRFMLSNPTVHKEVVTPKLARIHAQFAWSPGARRALVEHTRGYDADRFALLQCVGNVAAPTLVVWTDRDPFFPVSVGRQLCGALSSAKMEVIRDAGHLPQEERPAAFTRVVLDWLLANSDRSRAG